MKLTGKCAEAFKSYLKETKGDVMAHVIYEFEDLYQNALIIEFFDSVGIYVEIKNKFGQRKQCQRFSFVVKNYNSGFLFDFRTEATNKGIEKANEIFNNR